MNTQSTRTESSIILSSIVLLASSTAIRAVTGIIVFYFTSFYPVYLKCFIKYKICYKNALGLFIRSLFH